MKLKGNDHKNYIDKEVNDIKNNIEDDSIFVPNDINLDFSDNKNYTNKIRFPNEKFISLRKSFFPCLNTKYMYIISLLIYYNYII
jgi:hypothetical protein